MASNLLSKGSRVPYNLLTLLVRCFPHYYNNLLQPQCSKSTSVETDALDVFTSQLMQKKSGKWGSVKVKKQAPGKDCEILQVNDVINEDLRLASLNQINCLFHDAIDFSNYDKVVRLIQQCVQNDKCPSSVTVLLPVLSVIAQNGDKDLLVQICGLCKKHQFEFTESHSNFQHYVAEAIWVKGDVIKSLDIFEEVYRSNGYLRRRIRLMMKYLLNDSISNRSEAALVKIIGFSERLLREFKDVYIMSCVWQTCFLSEWYADHCTALDLLDKYETLRKSVINRIPYVVFISLRSHRTEVVYRLLEVLLKYKMKSQYSNVLASLLDHQIRNYDFNSCIEIIRWASENDIELPDNQNMLVINLLMNEKMQAPSLKIKTKSNEAPKYILKF